MINTFVSVNREKITDLRVYMNQANENIIIDGTDIKSTVIYDVNGRVVVN